MKWQRLPRKYEKEFYIQHLIIIYLSWRRHTDTITTDTHKKRIHLLRCSHECGEGTKSMGKRESGREKEREHIRKINVPRTHPVVFVDSMYQILLQTSNTTHTHTYPCSQFSFHLFRHWHEERMENSGMPREAQKKLIHFPTWICIALHIIG